MKVHANGMAIEIDVQGPQDGEPLLLVMGLSMQLIAWPQELVSDLASRGYRVIRMDNRDIGLSQHMHHLGAPNLAWAILRSTLRLPLHSPYQLSDMAKDAVGVLDALGVATAHVCGLSMGGMIAQHLAAQHAPRVRSLTLMMTSSGARGLGQPSLRVRRALIAKPAGNDAAALIRHGCRIFTLIGSPGFPTPPEQLRERVTEAVHRSSNPAGSVRQLIAIAADGDRSTLLSRITAPTLVIHGNADPLIPVAAGHDLARKISGARAEFIDGMGHDLPLALLPRLAAGIAANAQRARVTST